MPWSGKDGNHPGPWGSRPPGGPAGGGNGPGPGGPERRPPPPSPDFDFEAWLRRMREHLRHVFGGDGKDHARAFMTLAVGVILLWLASGIYLVGADEQGMVLRFGKYVRSSPPGIGYHLPYPFETVLTPRVTAVNRVEVGFRAGEKTDDVPEESLMLTGDENIVDIHFEVQWRIARAENYLFNVRNPDATVKAAAESAMREVIGATPIATATTSGKLQVEQDTQKLMQEILDSYNAGVEIVSVNLLKADPPAQVLDAQRDVQTALADAETARNQAEAYSNDILPRARGEAQKIILDAEGYQQQAVARAHGEADRFHEVYMAYQESKDVTRRRLYLETMEDILAGMNKVIVEGHGTVPYLPLPALKPPETKPEATP